MKIGLSNPRPVPQLAFPGTGKKSINFRISACVLKCHFSVSESQNHQPFLFRRVFLTDLVCYHFPTFNGWLILKISILRVVILRWRKAENNHLKYFHEIPVPLLQDLPRAQTSCGKSFAWRLLFENFLGVRAASPCVCHLEKIYLLVFWSPFFNKCKIYLINRS